MDIETIRIRIDPTRIIGHIKPLHDLHSGPLCMRGAVDVSDHYRALGVRNVRIHDAPWTFDNLQDINYIFPRFDMDADDPANYDFIQTDHYLKSIVALDANIIFRLGYSAEWEKTPPRHNNPPSDYEQWSRICTQIVRHYNHGWSNGFEMGIRYWEIWNEPDIDMFWTGSPEQFYRLFEVTSSALKTLDPRLKVGGPGICNLPGNAGFLEGLLNHCRAASVAIDFISWHAYKRDPNEVADCGHLVKRLAAQYGYESAETILDEWSLAPRDWEQMKASPEKMQYYCNEMHGIVGAAYNAAVLTRLQDTPLDIATFFSGTTFMWGLFNQCGIPHKAYYGFVAFSELLSSPGRIEVYGSVDPDITALAGLTSDGGCARVLLSNYSANPKMVHLSLDGARWSEADFRLQALDASSSKLDDVVDCQTSAGQIDFRLNAPSVALVTITSPK